MKIAILKFRFPLLAACLGLAATLPTLAMATDESQPLRTLTVLNAKELKYTEPDETLTLKVRIDGWAKKCQLKPHGAKKFVTLDEVNGTGEKDISITSPDNLESASKDKLKYTVKCKNGGASSQQIVKIASRIVGIKMTATPGLVPDVATDMTFRLQTLPEKGKTVNKCQVALPRYDEVTGQWSADTGGTWHDATKLKSNSYEFTTAMQTHLQASHTASMNHQVCIKKVPFAARCLLEGAAGEEPEYIEGVGGKVTVELKPRKASIKLISTEPQITGVNDQFNLELTQSGDIHSCELAASVNGGAAQSLTDILGAVAIKAEQSWTKESPASLRLTDITASPQAKATITVTATCKSKISYNNDGDGMCPTRKHKTSKAEILYNPTTDPSLMLTATPDVVTGTGQSVEVTYRRSDSDAQNIVVSCVHSEYDGRAWSTPSSTWIAGSTLVSSTEVIKTHPVPPSLDGVSVLRYDALCTYANGKTASHQVEVPVQLPVTVDIAVAPKADRINEHYDASLGSFECDNDETSAMERRIDFQFFRKGPGSSCQFTKRIGGWFDIAEISWVSSRHADWDKDTTGTAYYDMIPSCRALGLNPGETTEITYRVHCLPDSDDDSNEDEFIITVLNPGPVPNAPTFKQTFHTWSSSEIIGSSIAVRGDWIEGAIMYQWSIVHSSQQHPEMTHFSEQIALSRTWPAGKIESGFNFDSQGRLQPGESYLIKYRVQYRRGFGSWSPHLTVTTLSRVNNPDNGIVNGFRWRGHLDDNQPIFTYPLNPQPGDFYLNSPSYGRNSPPTYGRFFSPYMIVWWQSFHHGNTMFGAGNFLGTLLTPPAIQNGKWYFDLTQDKLFYGKDNGWVEVKAQDPYVPQESESQSGDDPPQA